MNLLAKPYGAGYRMSVDGPEGFRSLENAMAGLVMSCICLAGALLGICFLVALSRDRYRLICYLAYVDSEADTSFAAQGTEASHLLEHAA